MKLTSLFLTILLSVTFLSSCQFDVLNSSSNNSGYSTTSDGAYDSKDDVYRISDAHIVGNYKIINDVVYEKMIYHLRLNMVDKNGKFLNINYNDINLEYDHNYLKLVPNWDYLNDDFYCIGCSKNSYYLETIRATEKTTISFAINNITYDVDVKILSKPEQATAIKLESVKIDQNNSNCGFIYDLDDYKEMVLSVSSDISLPAARDESYYDDGFIFFMSLYGRTEYRCSFIQDDGSILFDFISVNEDKYLDHRYKLYLFKIGLEYLNHDIVYNISTYDSDDIDINIYG